MTTATGTWYCIPCGATSNTGAFCAMCGRRREHATDAARWQRFFTADAVVAPCEHDEWLPCDSDRSLYVECATCGTVREVEPDFGDPRGEV